MKSSQSPSAEGGQAKDHRANNKRDRVPISCTECHRRKKRCSRGSPCTECISREKPKECIYLKPVLSNNEGVTQAARSRITNRRRFTTKQNVVISPESVEELARIEHEASMLSYSESGTSATLMEHEFQMRPYDFELPGLDWPLGQEMIDPMLFGSMQTDFSEHNGIYPEFQTSLQYSAGNEGTFLDGDLLNTSGFYQLDSEPFDQGYLMNNFLTIVVKFPSESWLQYAFNHPPLFSATLFVSAVYTHRRENIQDDAALYFYRLQTIQLANEVLRTGTEAEKISDEMIMVAVILLYFTVCPDVCWKEYSTHMNGIQNMVSTRGGADHLGMKGIPGKWLHFVFGPWSPGFEYGEFSKMVVRDEKDMLEQWEGYL